MRKGDYRGSFPGIAVVDFFGALLVVYSALLGLSIMMANIEQQAKTQSHLGSKALYLIRADWPTESLDDVDLYVQDPAGHLVFFKQKDSGFLNLDRDDTGRNSNFVSLPDGTQVEAAYNEENVQIRGLIVGEYIVNLHLYHQEGGASVKVEVVLFKRSADEDIEIHRAVVILSKPRQEATAFRFTLTADNRVVDINTLPKFFVDQALKRQ